MFIDYIPLASGTGYVPSTVMLELVARSTGEPCELRGVSCDAAGFADAAIADRALAKEVAQGLFLDEVESFDALLRQCLAIQKKANSA